MTHLNDLQREERKLQGLKRERDTVNARQAQELKQAIDNGALPIAIAQIKQRNKDSDDLRSRLISVAEARVNELKERAVAQRKEEVKQAQAELDKQKDKALSAWQNNGGDPLKFEAAWEEMKLEMVKQKTLDALKPPQKKYSGIPF